jgi:hypothetical protein
MAHTPKLPKAIGILSSVDLTNFSHDLFNDIEDGYGANHKSHHINVPRDQLGNQRDDLIANGCEILATVGGLFVNSDIIGDTNNVEFVSLVGEIPTLPSNSKCVGGVSLESVGTAPQRRQYLIDHKNFTYPSTVGLYRHKPDTGTTPGTTRTQVSRDEETQWNNSSTIFDSTGNFDRDFNGGTSAIIPTTIKAIVISASPFFLVGGNVNALVKAANKWLQDTSRLIVYPVQTYQEANPGPQASPNLGVKRIILLGPDLHMSWAFFSSRR